LKQTISILGCGWLGKQLAIEFAEKGYNVKGSVTSKDKLAGLKSKRIEPFIVDINVLEKNFSSFLEATILIISIPTKSNENFKKVISKIEKSEIRKVIFISSTSVYPNANGVVTEKTPTKTTTLSEIENLFRKSNLNTTIIRFGGLFGYDRKPGNFVKNRVVKNPDGYINLIHRDDCIQIIKRIIEQDYWNVTLNACADSHPIRRDFYTKELSKIGGGECIFDEQSTTEYKIVSTKKLKQLVNYSFKYSDLMAY